MQKWEIRVYKESCSNCRQGQPNRNQSSLRKHKILDIEGQKVISLPEVGQNYSKYTLDSNFQFLFPMLHKNLFDEERNVIF